MADYQKEISKEIEDHKRDISKELYQFQTKYSLLHQKKAEVIEEFYGIIVALEKSIELRLPESKSKEQQDEELKETIKKYNEYLEFYRKKQIYFDEELCNHLEIINCKIREVIEKFKATSFSDYKSQMQQNELDALNGFKNEFPKLKKELRNTFQQFLSPENPNYQFIKKQ